ncbi:multicopper oxidase domain-containing protein [Nocardioides sp. cx-169]|uniref:multicopper oxidase family protein n=1 Tax=Nocardioides sp. cx-169 TaxID=2899080 RepID=UPI001E3F33CE|nr:multicopper oxidase domain-containing protein [Nocardioides sp. cx-169]MCD4533424.1 multicopper oxidase domain-containing protein [Nocardioides sp. cx-169]
MSERRRRPRWLRALVVLACVAALPVATFAGFVAWSFVTMRTDTVGEVEFDRALAIPPLAPSRLDGQGRRVFDLTLQAGETDLGRDRPTPTWGVNGSYLGPTLRAVRGEEVLVNVDNDLDEATTLHWHGMHLPARMDGGPHQMVAPGARWSPTWRVDQPAATLWYHPHPHGETARHVYRGLAGLFLLDDPAEAAVQERLPSTYGVDDVPVIVQDKRFDGHELDESGSFLSGVGLLGDTVLVNGTPGPYLDVTTERVRLRLVNASNARVYDFHLSDDRRFDVIASDGGLLPRTVRSSSIQLSPGERAEIVVKLSPGETAVLRSRPQDNGGGRFAGADDALDVLQLRAADELAPSPAVPRELAAAPSLDPADVVTTRDFTLSGERINGRQMDMSRIDLVAEVDTTERWRVRNADGTPHNFHVHDVQFAVESVDGRAPPPELAGWKDTVFVPPGGEVELLVRFSDYTDPDLPYMYHCHLLRHEDRGMMGQFVVVERGAPAGSPPDGHDH